MWTVRFSVSDNSICTAVYITTVCVWCGCGSGGTCRFGTYQFWDRERFKGSTYSSSSDNIFCGTLAFCVLSYESRKTCKLYISSRYGRVYNGDMHYYNIDAGAKTTRRNFRNRRIARTFKPSYGNDGEYKYTIAYTRCFVTYNTYCF